MCAQCGRGCSSVGRASDRYAAHASSILRCGKGFFSQSQLSVQILSRCPYTPCAIDYIITCAHVKDPVVHVRVRRIKETLKHPACIVGWVARLCCSWLSPGKSNPTFPLEKSQRDNTVAVISEVYYIRGLG